MPEGGPRYPESCRSGSLPCSKGCHRYRRPFLWFLCPPLEDLRVSRNHSESDVHFSKWVIRVLDLCWAGLGIGVTKDQSLVSKGLAESTEAMGRTMEYGQTRAVCCTELRQNLWWGSSSSVQGSLGQPHRAHRMQDES